jgi:hypothetical protein
MALRGTSIASHQRDMRVKGGAEVVLLHLAFINTSWMSAIAATLVEGTGGVARREHGDGTAQLFDLPGLHIVYRNRTHV